MNKNSQAHSNNYDSVVSLLEEVRAMSDLEKDDGQSLTKTLESVATELR